MIVNDNSSVVSERHPSLIDDSKVVNRIETSLTDDTRVVIYDCHMFIVQATGVNVIFFWQKKRTNKLKCLILASLSSLIGHLQARQGAYPLSGYHKVLPRVGYGLSGKGFLGVNSLTYLEWLSALKIELYSMDTCGQFDKPFMTKLMVQAK